ncbi:hypothetical protein [Streptomyces sp. H27-C3]|uniref:hypothetical protein n=1 Tax=Streptomyces sp. H27-C3 TaxID=3046305 RepID=UPI0024BAF177|nr:hypothetical protein [Streptomyces sp. H27-C3]MDJ0460579.1 hypothetical protein [Streptomyces sp. H27-C3]
MAYRKKTSQGITVSLKDHEVYGAESEPPEVIARRTTLDEYLLLTGLVEEAETEEGGDNRMVQQIKRFGESLISWNIEEEDGSPTPATSEEFFRLDEDLALALTSEWLARIGGKVYGPLPQSSPDGEQSPVVSIPMEPLSAPQPPTAVPA